MANEYNSRGNAMANQVDVNDIKEHAEVLGSDQQHVGKVDHLEGTDKIKLTKNDPDAGKSHHLIPLDWVQSVENGKVILNKTAEDAQNQWHSL